MVSPDKLLHRPKASFDDPSPLKARQHRREDVSGAADRGRVAQSLRRFGDGGHDLSATRRAALGRFGPRSGERAGTQKGACPGPKILGAETLSHDFLDVVVDVPPPYVDPFAIVPSILEDLARLAGQSAHDLRDSLVV